MQQSIKSELRLNEAELIFGAIKDENMSGKLRVSIVPLHYKVLILIQILDQY